MRNFKGSTGSREALEMRSTIRRTRPARARDAVRRHSVSVTHCSTQWLTSRDVLLTLSRGA